MIWGISPDVARDGADSSRAGRSRGNHYVTRASVIEIFAEDRGHSVLRIPLDRATRQIETMPWVEHATVRRALPNTIEVEITERTPIAFLRDGSGMALVDVHGVILDRPLKGNFHFPVVTGISSEMPHEDREARMQLFCGFHPADGCGAPRAPGAGERSGSLRREGCARDAHWTAGQGSVRRATRPAMRMRWWSHAERPVLVHFGDSDFERNI